jgi:death-on-curing protein
MITLTVDEIILLHEKIITATGGPSGLRDYGLLESAVLGCYQSFEGNDVYPSVVEKAARLAYSLCNNHAFVDGNKRVAVTAMLVLLRMNNIELAFTQKELISLGLGIASGSVGYDDILTWLTAKLIPNSNSSL